MQSSIEHALDQMVEAWNAGDARAYASLFAEDATYVIFAGSTSIGREAIRRDHEPVLSRFQKGSRMRMSISSVRSIGDDVALVLTEGGVGTGKRIPLDKVQSFVFRRQNDGRWLCEAFQNTKKHRLMMWFFARSTRDSPAR
ncbi:SgcJ/EcaC family oxidoreductase [Paramicrobacterium fandaimingii]|uniref:SgcJ/EcaC family oxidoreductase n=1 Tax=Paramicrobacterium fandaimingii TaxID=2708079 RepID=UPI00141E95E8|nr:SgcJ/EcaC family oxidoreductase [Microbacterium fandaimingii]